MAIRWRATAAYLLAALLISARSVHADPNVVWGTFPQQGVVTHRFASPPPQPAPVTPVAAWGPQQPMDQAGNLWPAPPWAQQQPQRSDSDRCASGDCDTSQQQELFRLSADFLLWWVRSSPTPFPLVTQGTNGPLATGALGTVVLFGQENFNGDNPYSGMRLRLVGCGEACVLDMSGFFLENKTSRFAGSAGPDSTVILGRPFLNADTGNESVSLITFPNALSGGVTSEVRTRAWGAEANLTWRGSGLIEFFYGGFRYLGLRDDIQITDTSTIGPAGLSFFNGQPVTTGDVLTRSDLFRTLNNFYGPQLGIQTAVRRNNIEISGRAALAMGATVESLTVRGNTTLTNTTGVTTTTPGGLLALGSNSRSVTRYDFAVVPEMDLTLGVWVIPQARLSVGYNFLYCSSVIRPGDQFDRAISQTQLPTSPLFDPTVPATRPAPLFKATDFWIQGINFALLVTF